MSLTVCQSNGMFKIQHTQYKHIVIMGPAGSGKTYLLRQFLDSIEHSGVSRDSVIFCAPTHAAKDVIQETINSGRNPLDFIKAHTIHSILRIHPETYEDEIVFDPSGEVPEIEGIKYIVVDEVSMLDGILTHKLVESANKNNFRIIALGDPYQIQPVNPDGCYNHPTLGRISPIFFHTDFDRVILEEIVRQSKDNPIIQVATRIRKQGSDIYECISENGIEGVFKIQSERELVDKYLEYVTKPSDMLDYKLMAFTNAKVDAMNAYVRRKLFNTSAEYVTSEYLVMQEPVYDRSGKFSRRVYNNGEICEIIGIHDDCEIEETFEVEDLVYDKFIDGGDDDIGHYEKDYKEPPITLKVWRLNLRSVKDKVEYEIYSIRDIESQEKLNEYLTLAATIFKEKGKEIDEYITMYKKKVKMTAPNERFKINSKISELREEKREMWNRYWCLKSKFVSVKGAAACTLHKSQGATFTGVFVSTDKLDQADQHLARQLKYVATTRAKKFVRFV